MRTRGRRGLILAIFEHTYFLNGLVGKNEDSTGPRGSKRENGILLSVSIKGGRAHFVAWESFLFFLKKYMNFFLHKNRADLCLIFMKTANSHHVPFWTYIYQKMGQTESIGSK